MPAERTCPRCGAALASDALEGLCPTCVGRAAFANASAFEKAGAAGEPALSPEMEAELARLKPEEAGEQIGQYKLMEQIGEGGFGTVWVADQERPMRRRVALKIIKLGMDTKEVIARFEQERQALAMMDHPHIAKVFDAGATQWGRPFFVMELVRGVRITDYCDRANLPTAERLALFIQVCNAVQHAHQKGIIHRDLKPSNILVTLHDGVPVPKVIDFGVAKATQQQRLTDLTIYTQFQQMIGTPLYMSPEQAEMSGLDIDTRSDIYSLGVLLYELLTGRTPFDPEEMMKAGLDEMRRVIREQEPQTPSMFLKTMADATRASVAQRRQSDPAKLTNLVRGDLDWIVMKSLEKDRARRYETARGLAEDIERHLANEPVLARAPSNFYRLKKLVRRNKSVVAATAAIITALVCGTIISICQERRAARAERQAVDEASKSQQVANFLVRLMGEGTQVLTKGGEVRFIKIKALDADYLATAENMFREVLLFQKTRFGEKSPEVVITLMNIASLQQHRHDLTEANSTISKALELVRGRFRESTSLADGRLLARTLIQIAALEEAGGDHDGGGTKQREALGLLTQLYGENSSDVVEEFGSMETVMRLRGDAAGAAMLLRKGMEEAIKYDYENPLRYYELIALLADTGDEEAYKKYCRAMLTQFSNSQDIVVAERTAKACLLLPLGAAELEAASRLASFSVTQADPSSKDLAYFELVNGLACYRLGQHSVAIGWIDKCLAHGQVWSRQFDASREVAAYAVRAMAFAQLEQRREAQADLTQAGAILKTDAPNESFPSAATLGIDWTICNVLLREASKLIVQ